MSNLRELRIKAGLTQEELAKKSGFSSQSAISNYENGHRQPGVDELLRIRDALRTCGVDATLEELIGPASAA